MRPSLASLAASALLVFLACSHTPEPTHAALVDVGRTDGGRTDILDSPPAADEERPSSGSYRVTVSVISDACSIEYRAPEPFTALVTTTPEGEVEIPLVAVPPSNATGGSARKKLPLAPGHATKDVHTPFAQCPSYETTRTAEVVRAGAKGFTVAFTVDHGDAMRCSSLQPSNCRTKVLHTYERTRDAR